MPEKEQPEILSRVQDRLYYLCVRYLDRFVFAQPQVRDPLQPVDQLLSREIVGIGALGAFLGMLYIWNSGEAKPMMEQVFSMMPITPEQVLNTTSEDEAVQRFLTFGVLVYGAAFLDRFPDIARAVRRLTSATQAAPAPDLDAAFPQEKDSQL